MKNGIKYLIAGLVATGLTVSSSYAAISAAFTAEGSSFVTDNTGPANYLDGDLVEIGTFTNGAPTVGSSSLSFFDVFGSILTADGAFSGNGAAVSAGVFSHAQIYLVVFNAATQGAATQEAIVDVSDASNSRWKFPADADVPNNTSISLDDLFATPGPSATLATGATVVYGTVGVDPGDGGPFSLLETKLIPEPSTYMLVGTGLLGLLGLRRRRS